MASGLPWPSLGFVILFAFGTEVWMATSGPQCLNQPKIWSAGVWRWTQLKGSPVCKPWNIHGFKCLGQADQKTMSHNRHNDVMFIYVPSCSFYFSNIGFATENLFNKCCFSHFFTLNSRMLGFCAECMSAELTILTALVSIWTLWREILIEEELEGVTSSYHWLSLAYGLISSQHGSFSTTCQAM